VPAAAEDVERKGTGKDEAGELAVEGAVRIARTVKARATNRHLTSTSATSKRYRAAPEIQTAAGICRGGPLTAFPLEVAAVEATGEDLRPQRAAELAKEAQTETDMRRINAGGRAGTTTTVIGIAISVLHGTDASPIGAEEKMAKARAPVGTGARVAAFLMRTATRAEEVAEEAVPVAADGTADAFSVTRSTEATTADRPATLPDGTMHATTEHFLASPGIVRTAVGAEEHAETTAASTTVALAAVGAGRPEAASAEAMAPRAAADVDAEALRRAGSRSGPTPRSSFLPEVQQNPRSRGPDETGKTSRRRRTHTTRPAQKSMTATKMRLVVAVETKATLPSDEGTEAVEEVGTEAAGTRERGEEVAGIQV
jgi:hypothetical protein